MSSPCSGIFGTSAYPIYNSPYAMTLNNKLDATSAAPSGGQRHTMGDSKVQSNVPGLTGDFISATSTVPTLPPNQSPGKRDFSASHVMVASEPNPSPKRRHTVSNSGKTNAGNPEDYSKYYRELAQKYNFHLSDTTVPASNPQSSASAASPGGPQMYSTQPAVMPRQKNTDPSHNPPIYQPAEARMREQTKAIQELQIGQMMKMRVERRRAQQSNKSHQGLGGPATGANFSGVQYAPQHPAPTNFHAGLMQSVAPTGQSHGGDTPSYPDPSQTPSGPYAGYQENTSGSVAPSNVPRNDRDIQDRPRTDIYSVPPQYRQQYQLYEEDLMNGVEKPTNLPSWLELKAKQQAGIVPSNLLTHDPETGEDYDEWRPAPEPYRRIEATAETGPLPNINQPYTGVPGRLPRQKLEFPYGPVTVPPAMTPPRKIAMPKKRTPASEKKTATTRKSRTKKPSQSTDQFATPPAKTRKAPAPAHDFSSPTDASPLDATTLKNMKAGNFSQFFESTEAEAKWKQDALDATLASFGKPSNRQLEKAAREKRKMEKEMMKAARN